MCWFYSRILIVYQWKEMGIEMRLSRRNLSSKLAPGGFWTNILRTQCNIIKISQMIELINHLEFYTKQSKKKISAYGSIKHCNSMGRGPFRSFRKGITGAGPPLWSGYWQQQRDEWNQKAVWPEQQLCLWRVNQHKAWRSSKENSSSNRKENVRSLLQGLATLGFSQEGLAES